MKINTSVMVIKVGDIKEGKNKPYYMLTICDLDGNIFDIMVTDITTYNNYKAFDKVDIDLELTSSKYGLSLKII